MLESLVEHDAAATVRLSELKRVSEVATLDAEFDAARARGNEGLMIKDPRSSYKPGKRGREWLKLKRALATLDVVVTSVEVGHGKRRHLLSDYTFAVRRSEEDPELLNVGKAYSGLTDAELAELTEWFRAHTLQEFAHGRVRVVEPKIILEVTFDRVQESRSAQERLRPALPAHPAPARRQVGRRDRHARRRARAGGGRAGAGGVRRRSEETGGGAGRAPGLMNHDE